MRVQLSAVMISSVEALQDICLSLPSLDPELYRLLLIVAFHPAFIFSCTQEIVKSNECEVGNSLVSFAGLWLHYSTDKVF